MSDTDPSQTSRLSGLLGPTLIVALGGLVAYFTNEPALKSRRPDPGYRQRLPEPPSPPGLQAVHSRLWDDPLAVAYTDSNERGKANATALLPEALRKVLRINDKSPDVRPYFHSMAIKFLDASGDGKGRFLCLPVLVPGEPYEGDTEARRRITYAVLSALASCGYELSYPDRLSYVEIPVEVDERTVGKQMPVQLVVPAKVFRRSDVSNLHRQGPDGVLVCWINEDQLGDRPLAVIGQVLERLFGAFKRKKEIEIRIVGPADSDTLLAMALEDAHWNDKSWRRSAPPIKGAYDRVTQPQYFSKKWKEVRLYSGRATISPDALTGDFVDKTSPKGALSNFMNLRAKVCGLTVARTIGNDQQLAQSLAHELFLRGAWPLSDDPARNPDAKPVGPARHIVLVAERDTLYGSALPAVIRNRFPKLLAKAPDIDPENDYLHVFTYLRGLDGKVPGEKKDDSEQSSDKSSQDGGQEPQIDRLRSRDLELIPASGKSQFDYLRRLEQELVEFDQKQRNMGGQGIAAIGVVGTDIYDKLLVFRALRKRFPGAWFFSTDLDAELSLSGEYATTRNLLVASHFGLELRPDLQREIPPFRDSYQTAVYFTCLRALDDSSAGQALDRTIADDPWGASGTAAAVTPLQPLLFEIGRSGPYQMTIPRQNGSSNERVHPPGPRDAEHWFALHWGKLLVAVLLFAACWCFVHGPTDKFLVSLFMTPEGAVISIIAALGLSVVFLWGVSVAVHDHTAADGEPFVLFDGISNWPATLVHLAVVVFSVALLAKGIRELSRLRSWKLKDRCAPVPPTAVPPPPAWHVRLKTAASHFAADLKTPFSSMKKLLRAVTRIDLFDPVSALYDQYAKKGSTARRMAIAIGFALVFFGFSFLLFSMTETPNSPFRGPRSQAWALGSTLAAVACMLVLVFFVLDAVQLGKMFVKGAACDKVIWNSKTMLDWYTQRQPRIPNDLREVLTIDVIAELTYTVGKLVNYPFMILFLMIVARHPMFDNFELSWPLVLVWGLIAAALLYAAHDLRRSAAKARTKVLVRLRSALSAALAAKQGERSEQIRQYITEVEREARGAFRPWLEDPLVQALAWGGTGSAVLIQQLLPYT